jgi:SAM-dependent methyltransferase
MQPTPPSAIQTHGFYASRWVTRFADLVPAGGTVLDVAAGAGRHSRLFLERGHPVVAIDRNLSQLGDLAGRPGLTALAFDLETGAPWPVAGQAFAGIVVTNYLYRPLLPAIVDAVAPGGVLIYETFARGHERFGEPRNPNFQLKPGELLDAVLGKLRVLAYEDLEISEPGPAAVQRIAARKAAYAVAPASIGSSLPAASSACSSSEPPT